MEGGTATAVLLERVFVSRFTVSVAWFIAHKDRAHTTMPLPDPKGAIGATQKSKHY